MKSTIQTVSPVILDFFYIHALHIKIRMSSRKYETPLFTKLFDRSDKHLQSAYTAFSKQKIPIDYTKSINFLQALPSPPDKVS